MIDRWESDLHEDPREAIAAAADAQAILEAEGYKVGEIRWDYVIVYDEAGVGTIAGKQSFFYFGLPEDTLPGEEDARASRAWALAIGGGSLAILVVTVVGLGIWGSKKGR